MTPFWWFALGFGSGAIAFGFVGFFTGYLWNWADDTEE